MTPHLVAVLGRLVAVMTVVAATAACGGDTTGGSGGRSSTTTVDTPASVPVSPPTTRRQVNVVASAAVDSVAVYDEPGQPEPVRTLENPAPPYGAPLVLLVRTQQPDWLEVLLPVRPNGRTGWIRSGDVTLTTHEFRMVVELGAHRLTLWQGESVFDQQPVGVGTEDTPTPGGTYYTKELIRPIDEEGRLMPDGPYGPYAYGLSGFSDVLYDFAGGDGVIGIHGTNDPSSIGRDVSAGCIRVSNEAITRWATTLPIGVPVEIRP